MKLKMIMYWIATALIALETLAGGIVDLIHGRTGIFSGPHVTDVLIVPAIVFEHLQKNRQFPPWSN